jgi:hypothetical protein
MSKSALEKTASRITEKQHRWHKNAKAAMMRQPDYFVWWYTVKSVGLCVAVGAACYYAGKAAGRKA